jgi:hypothetical protein
MPEEVEMVRSYFEAKDREKQPGRQRPQAAAGC